MRKTVVDHQTMQYYDFQYHKPCQGGDEEGHSQNLNTAFEGHQYVHKEVFEEEVGKGPQLKTCGEHH